MSFPAVATTNSGNQNTATTSHTANLPASIASGDLLIVFFSKGDTGAPTTPAGWSQLATKDGTSFNITILYKVASGSEGSTLSITTGTSVRSSHTSYRVTNYGAGTPLEAQSTAIATANPDPPSLTPSWAQGDALWFVAAGQFHDGTSTFSTYPTNYASGVSNISSAAGGTSIATAQRTINAASQDPSTYAFSGSKDAVAYTVAVRPYFATFTISETVTMTEVKSVTRGAIFSILETMTLTEAKSIARGAIFSVLDTVTATDLNNIIFRWTRAAKSLTTFLASVLHTTIWTKANEDTTTFTNINKS